MTGTIFVISARKLSSSGYILSSIPHWVTLKRVWNILDPRIRKFLCLPHWLHEFTILSLVLFDKSSYRERKRSWNSKKVKECHCILSYTVIYAANSHTYYYRYSITHSHFHSRLKTFLFCKSFPLQPFFFFFSTDYMIPQTFTVTSEHIRFYFLVFLFYTFELSAPCGRLSWLMSAFERTLK